MSIELPSTQTEPNFHYELPDGTISVSYSSINAAHMAGCKATWDIADMDAMQVKVFDGNTGKYVPSYEYCEDCNYDKHICGGCGDSVKHEQGRSCGTGCTE